MSALTVTAIRLALKAAGFSPIPCRGKRPWLDQWQHKLNAGEEEMRRWPGRNTGMLCARNPAFDTDITDPEAADAVEETVKDYFSDRGEIPVRFGNRPKRALLFRTSKPFSKIIANLVDPQGRSQRIEVLGDGQQMVVDGIHPNTKQPYTWFDANPWDVGHDALVEVSGDEMQACVDRVVAMLEKRFGYTQAQANGRGGKTAEAGTGRVDVAAELAAMHYGNIDRTLNRVILPMLRRGDHPNDVLALTVKRAMEEGKRAGATKPNGDPWTHDEQVKDCATRINTAYRTILEEYHPSQGIPLWLPGDYHVQWLAILAGGGTPTMFRNATGYCVRPSQKGSKQSPREGAVPPAPTRLFRLKPYKPVDPATFPPRQWLYGRHYQRGTVSGSVAPGGFGKTSLIMVEGVAMATARNLLGEQPEERLRVWYHNGDDDDKELGRRLLAICQHYGIPQEELAGWFFSTTAADVPLKVAHGYGDLKLDQPLIECIRMEIADNAIDVGILDPLVTLHNVSEQDNQKMDAVVRIFGGIAAEQECAIELAHHTRKLPPGSGADYAADDARGASSMKDAVRALRALNHMPPEDARNFGIDEHERTSYFRVDKAKGNNAPPALATWRHFVNVRLPNEDEVGVVEAWACPGHGAPSEAMAAAELLAENTFLTLLTRFILQGRNVSHSPGGSYAPAMFAREREAKAAKTGKAALADAMRRLFAANRIKVAEGRGAGGKSVNCIAVA